MKAVEWILRQLRSLSPYLAVALLLPGGSIVAFLLWISAQNRAATDSEAIARQNGQPRRCYQRTQDEQTR